MYISNLLTVALAVFMSSNYLAAQNNSYAIYKL